MNPSASGAEAILAPSPAATDFITASELVREYARGNFSAPAGSAIAHRYRPGTFILEGLEHLERLPDLSPLNGRITRLIIHDAYALRDITALASLPELRELEFHGARTLADLTGVEKLGALRKLILRGWSQ